ncbi:hypothetical protein B0H19DRAFT_567575 [Mycena capillaripes]|nr:hypothetical protein B0H19DRAFT_567575 [Mycena capillaripes]
MQYGPSLRVSLDDTGTEESTIADVGPQWTTAVADFLDDLYARAEIEKAELPEKLRLKEEKKLRSKRRRTGNDIVAEEGRDDLVRITRSAMSAVRDKSKAKTSERHFRQVYVLVPRPEWSHSMSKPAAERQDTVIAGLDREGNVNDELHARPRRQPSRKRHGLAPNQHTDTLVLPPRLRAHPCNQTRGDGDAEYPGVYGMARQGRGCWQKVAETAHDGIDSMLGGNESDVVSTLRPASARKQRARPRNGGETDDIIRTPEHDIASLSPRRSGRRLKQTNSTLNNTYRRVIAVADSGNPQRAHPSAAAWIAKLRAQFCRPTSQQHLCQRTRTIPKTPWTPGLMSLPLLRLK